MKRLLLIALCALVSVNAFGQAKKPTIMVVPSNQWCIANGYCDEVDLYGTKTQVANYEKALIENADLNSVIISFGNEMADRGFPLQDLAATIESIKLDEALNDSDIAMSRADMILNRAKADIMLEVSWDVVETNYDKYSVRYTLKGIDSYSRKQITGCDLIGPESAFVSPAKQLRQVLTDSFDSFCTRLDKYFADMGANGREVSFTFLVKTSSAYDFSTEVGNEGYVLSDILEMWFDENTVSGRYTVPTASDTRWVFEQVRIPLYDDRGTAIDARRYINTLVRKLRSEYGVTPIKIITLGLGSCRIEIG